MSSFLAHYKKFISNRASIKEYHPVLWKPLIFIFRKFGAELVSDPHWKFCTSPYCKHTLKFSSNFKFFCFCYGQNMILSPVFFYLIFFIFLFVDVACHLPHFFSFVTNFILFFITSHNLYFPITPNKYWCIDILHDQIYPSSKINFGTAIYHIP